MTKFDVNFEECFSLPGRQSNNILEFRVLTSGDFSRSDVRLIPGRDRKEMRFRFVGKPRVLKSDRGALSMLGMTGVCDHDVSVLSP